jgi:uncharacterized glyoxalase superfamily protein PhnB
MKEVPMGLYPFLRYEDCPAAIRFLVRAFGFEEKLVVPGEDGTIAHAQLQVPTGGIVMLGSVRRDPDEKVHVHSPRTLGGASAGIYIAIDDPDAHCARARAAGAEIFMPPTDQDYGSRDYGARDPEGNVWCFGTYKP